MNGPDLARALDEATALLLRQRLCRLPVRPESLELGLPVTIDTMQNFCAHTRQTMTELQKWDDMRDGCHLLLGGGKRLLILWNADITNPARRRFTLAHEIGHAVLGHRSDGAVEEAEANAFAAALLVPPVLAWELWRQSQDTAALSNIFCVSKSAAERCARGFGGGIPVFSDSETALLRRFAPLLPGCGEPVVDY